MSKYFLSIVINFVKFLSATFIGLLFLAWIISLQTSESICDILFHSARATSLLEESLKRIITEIPFLGMIFNQIFDFHNVVKLTPSSGFEQVFSFALMLTVVNGIVKPAYVYPSNLLKSSCKGIDIIFNTYILMILALCAVTGTVLLENFIINFLRNLSMPLALYNVVLLLFSIILILSYYFVMNKFFRKTKISLVVILLDLCIAMILMCFVYMLGLIYYVGDSNLTPQDNFIICILTIMLPFAGTYIIWLKNKYKI